MLSNSNDHELVDKCKCMQLWKATSALIRAIHEPVIVTLIGLKRLQKATALLVGFV